MRLTGSTLLLVVSCMGLTGCVETRVNDYVERVLAFGGKRPLLSQLDFRQTTTWMEPRTVCDQEVCGSREDYVCRSYYSCSNTFSALLGSRHPISDDPPHHGGPISDDPPHRGGPISNDPPDRGGPISNDPPSWGGGGGSDSCGYSDVCGYETVPVYCDVNCREELVTRSSTKKIPSSMKIEITGVEDTPKLRKRIKGLFVGVRTNEKFQQVLQDPNFLPKKVRRAFAHLKNTDRTVVILDAKGLELTPDQEFLRLDENFRAGDPVVIRLELRETGEGRMLSGEGTSVDFPALETRD